uniref:hypothetical protein n=1 Tax=Thaumasiovibrio occultus TaxID=1891184 RepID=UPI000B35872E|nr:hypothetical protein [Thaumasiovibrio occultus]
MLWIMMAIIITIGLFGKALNQHHERENARKSIALVYRLLELLRLLQQHSHVLHQQLTHHDKSDHNRQVIEKRLITLIASCCQESPKTYRAMFRILSTRIAEICTDNRVLTTTKNHYLHSKATRHALYLIDELLSQALIHQEKTALLGAYQKQWQLTLECLDSLAKFRSSLIAISDCNNANQFSHLPRLRHQAHLTFLRLRKLLDEQTDSYAGYVTLLDELQHVANPDQPYIEPHEIYQLSARISSCSISVFTFSLKRVCRSVLTVDNKITRFTPA